MKQTIKICDIILSRTRTSLTMKKPKNMTFEPADGPQVVFGKVCPIHWGVVELCPSGKHAWAKKMVGQRLRKRPGAQDG